MFIRTAYKSVLELLLANSFVYHFYSSRFKNGSEAGVKELRTGADALSGLTTGSDESMAKHGRKNYHLRELPSIPFCEQDVPQAMRAFVEADVLPRISFKGYKLPEKREIAIHAIHNLVMTGLVAACVSDERDTKQAGTRRRAVVWDAIVDAGLAKVCLGSQEDGASRSNDVHDADDCFLRHVLVFHP